MIGDFGAREVELSIDHMHVIARYRRRGQPVDQPAAQDLLPIDSERRRRSHSSADIAEVARAGLLLERCAIVISGRHTRLGRSDDSEL